MTVSANIICTEYLFSQIDSMPDFVILVNSYLAGNSLHKEQSVLSNFYKGNSFLIQS